MPIDKVNREKAAKEIESVAELYKAFQNGDETAKKFSVSADRIFDRLDVKNCLERPGRAILIWQKCGFDVLTLSDIIEPIGIADEDVINTKEADEVVNYLTVTYDGFVRKGEDIVASATQYSELYRVHTKSIIISNISAHYGAVAVVPEHCDGGVVTKEISIFEAKNGFDPYIVWVLLRSPEIRADFLLTAAGANRTRIDWERIKNIRVPKPSHDLAKMVVDQLMEADRLEREARANRERVISNMQADLKLISEEAVQILEAFKPPK